MSKNILKSSIDTRRCVNTININGDRSMVVVGGDQSRFKNEVIYVNLTKINNYFMNYKFINSLFIIFYITVIMQTHLTSLYRLAGVF